MPENRALTEGGPTIRQSKNLPDPVLVLRTYSELERYAKAFAQGHLNLLFLFGAAGLGKSRCIRNAIGKQACWVEGNATPFGIYMQAYECRNQPLVLDDVDGLYRDRAGIRLLKTLCQTDQIKWVAWQSDARTLERRDIPRRFTTTSRVVIIANQWRSLGADVAALEDRGHVLHFAPDAAEVHRQAASWFWDQEIFDFVADHLSYFASHSLRVYVLGWEQKQAGLPWKEMILSRCFAGTALVVARLKADASFQTEEDRVRAFVASGSGCRATYFNHSRRMQRHGERPKIALLHAAPPAPPGHSLDVLDLLRRRFGPLGEG